MKSELSLYEFKLLEDKEQYNFIFNHGKYLTYHLDGNKRYALYAVERFFVEVEYNVVSNKIENKVAFKTGEKLDRYSDLKNLF